MVGLTSVACCCSHAQRNPLTDLAPASTPPLDLSIDSSPSIGPLLSIPPSANPDLPAITAGREEALPDAPVPNIEATTSDESDPEEDFFFTGPAPQQEDKQTSPGFPPVSPTLHPLPPSRVEHPTIPSLPAPCQSEICIATPANVCCGRDTDYFRRFINSGVHPLTPRQKGMLAIHNTIDPYNFATIALISAISVASDPNSAYGPGFPGFSRNFGVAYCETAVGEFFGTFLVPSIFHQDPHYHRLPNASYPRRTLHAITQVMWTKSDYGAGMLNYSTLIATAIGDGLGNLYVPGRDTSLGATAARYATAIATDPIDNFISEFLPDVARRVNVHIVLVQQIVNHVAKEQ
jgi:hypothetical protein